MMFYVTTTKEDINPPLKALRLAAGISQRELARRIGEQNSNIAYWEKTGKTPRADLLAPIADALGCTIEDLLGRPTKRKAPTGGKMRQLFEAASELPRRQQDKIVSVLEPFVNQHSSH
jgi:transcriptional regulator with XRE-family HTH domain